MNRFKRINRMKRPPNKILEKWEPVLLRITNEAFTGLSYNVPGWRCRNCGAEYGCEIPPEKCWKCVKDPKNNLGLEGIPDPKLAELIEGGVKNDC